jgi:AraC-like DNA-binding protein
VPSHSPTESIQPRYTEHLPAAALAPWVECYWTIRATNTAALPHRVLPDGCSDIILGLAGAPGPMVVGTMRTAEVFPLTGAVDLAGVRFRPGAGAAFLDVPLGEITGQRIPLDVLWGHEARLLGDAPPDARIRCLEQALIERFARWTSDRRVDEPLVSRAIALLRQSRGGASIRGIASALGVGERRLERAFDRCVGLNPKAVDRVLRLRRALRCMKRSTEAGSRISWATIAFGAGYADQSHLIREFRSLAGVTPVQYAAERHGVGFVQDDDADVA